MFKSTTCKVTFSDLLERDVLTSPDGFATDGDELIIPELRGRITILDRDDHFICHLGNNEEVCGNPSWPDKTALLHGRFNSPHAAATDAARNLYVVEWRVGGRVLKLEQWNQAQADMRLQE